MNQILGRVCKLESPSIERWQQLDWSLGTALRASARFVQCTLILHHLFMHHLCMDCIGQRWFEYVFILQESRVSEWLAELASNLLEDDKFWDVDKPGLFWQHIREEWTQIQCPQKRYKFGYLDARKLKNLLWAGELCLWGLEPFGVEEGQNCLSLSETKTFVRHYKFEHIIWNLTET